MFLKWSGTRCTSGCCAFMAPNGDKTIVTFQKRRLRIPAFPSLRASCRESLLPGSSQWLLWWKLMLGMSLFSSERQDSTFTSWRKDGIRRMAYPSPPGWKQMCCCNGITPVSSLMYYLLVNVFIYTQLLRKLSCHGNGCGLICCRAGKVNQRDWLLLQLCVWTFSSLHLETLPC